MEDMQIIRDYPVDFLSFTYYRSRIAGKDYIESVQKDTNKSDAVVEGDEQKIGREDIVSLGKTNPYLDVTPSGPSIQMVCIWLWWICMIATRFPFSLRKMDWA